MMDIYTDGSSRGNPGPGGWGAVAVIGDEEVWRISGRSPYTTNNLMELTAVIEAINYASMPIDTIYTDSRYVQLGITSWIKKWKTNEWRTSGGNPVKNQYLWMTLDEIAQGIKFEWVKGHSKNKWNEVADQLASHEKTD